MKKLIVAAVCLLIVGCKSGKTPGVEDLFNDEARVGALPVPAQQWVPLTVSVDRGAGTTATLFGNPEAVKDARSGGTYQENAALELVTWRQREDPHWFGGRIPGEVVSVELVSVGSDGASYGRYAGSPLTRTADEDAARQAAIMSMKGAQLP